MFSLETPTAIKHKQARPAHPSKAARASHQWTLAEEISAKRKGLSSLCSPAGECKSQCKRERREGSFKLKRSDVISCLQLLEFAR